MNNLNSVLVEGQVQEDPALSYTEKGTAVCKFSIETVRQFVEDEELKTEVSYFDIEIFNRYAENCAEYLKKGRVVRVVGRLKQATWTEGVNTKRSRIFIVVEHVEFKPTKIEKKETTVADLRDSDPAPGVPV